MSVDKQALVAWLRDRSKHPNPLVGAVYQGLADRVQRGDFDKDKEVEKR
ncbi:hypothetical protein SCB71_06420 [Herbiconiux sp. KACC 21604]|nr:hypothetical protein [Herbiconiux sp. SALV-R1]QJU52951.1 hypothetical protein HL652_04405 [Herbiconiux sp. SALV-R1]WPO87873.1 hypothetical protein SCB71_06420 [Herbiconiux sp. KACC 21604]